MKTAIIKVVAVAAMMLSFAFSWVNSPAYALTTVPTINYDNFETEVVNSDKSVVAILVPKAAKDLPGYPSTENLVSEAQNTFGDQYKIVTGTIEDNGQIAYRIPAPLIFPPFPEIAVLKNGLLEPGNGIAFPPSNPKDAFKYVKDNFEGNA